MNVTKFVLGFATLALAVASAATSYKVTITDPEWVGNKQLKPGDYKVEVQGDKAVFMSGKKVVCEAPAKIETVPTKFNRTSLFTQDVNGKPMVGEIRIGGTNTKLVLQTTPSGSGGGQ